jgi:hypothetical protein
MVAYCLVTTRAHLHSNRYLWIVMLQVLTLTHPYEGVLLHLHPHPITRLVVVTSFCTSMCVSWHIKTIRFFECISICITTFTSSFWEEGAQLFWKTVQQTVKQTVKQNSLKKEKGDREQRMRKTTNWSILKRVSQDWQIRFYIPKRDWNSNKKFLQL